MSRTTTPASPAGAFAALKAKRNIEGDSFPSVVELRELVRSTTTYLEARVKSVEEICDPAPGNDTIEELQARIEKLAAREDKTDAEYVSLAVAERKLQDLNARHEKDKARAIAAQEVLARELLHFVAPLCDLLAETNSRALFRELETLLQPYLNGRPAIEAIQGIPAYHDAFYRNRWRRPSMADIEKAMMFEEEIRIGTDNAVGAIRYLEAALEGAFFTGRTKK